MCEVPMPMSVNEVAVSKEDSREGTDEESHGLRYKSK